jgi:hypothetical protein
MSANLKRKQYLPELITSGVIFLFFLIARFIYYELDHGLRSEWTNYAFTPGLVAFLVSLFFCLTHKWRADSLSIGLFLGASFSLSLFLFIKGVLVMASASSVYNIILLVLALALYLVSLLFIFIKRKKAIN